MKNQQLKFAKALRPLIQDFVEAAVTALSFLDFKTFLNLSNCSWQIFSIFVRLVGKGLNCQLQASSQMFYGV